MYDAAIVSDLHIRNGQADDDFLFDQEFSELLGDMAADGVNELVLNGDIFEFICQWPDFPSHLDPSLGLTQQESMVRFQRILEAHPIAFEALRKWVGDGRSCVYILGNHDWDFHWPDLQEGLQKALGGEIRWGLHGKAYRPLPDVYITHGHQLISDHHTYRYPTEPLRPSPFGGPQRLEQTVGNYVLRHFINPIEQVYPFANNVRPLGKVKWLELTGHFWNLVRMLRTFLRQTLYERPSFMVPRWMYACVARGEPSLAELLTAEMEGPEGQLVATPILRMFADDQAVALRLAAQRFLWLYRGVRHIILGHSHDYVFKDDPFNAQFTGRYYLNPGPWIPCHHVAEGEEALSLVQLDKGHSYPYRLAFARVREGLWGTESWCEVFSEGNVSLPRL
jgi:UDP-2,3-diacylglucosamine pyrophosphatase LpxH